jgi:hypothetical protein
MGYGTHPNGFPNAPRQVIFDQIRKKEEENTEHRRRAFI